VSGQVIVQIEAVDQGIDDFLGFDQGDPCVTWVLLNDSRPGQADLANGTVIQHQDQVARAGGQDLLLPVLVIAFVSVHVRVSFTHTQENCWASQLLWDCIWLRAVSMAVNLRQYASSLSASLSVRVVICLL